jgi:hypothetical protein
MHETVQDDGVNQQLETEHILVQASISFRGGVSASIWRV